MSMFSFQAIHNTWNDGGQPRAVVYRLCQCSLFKQFTTAYRVLQTFPALFIDYVNVLFSSNSQRQYDRRNDLGRCLSIMSMFSFQAIHNGASTAPAKRTVVYRLCQCSLFKQFTTERHRNFPLQQLFIDYVNVLFSSNSQHRCLE